MRQRCTFAIIKIDGEPPKELRLFEKGWNTSVKGDFLFDDAAAKDVLAYQARRTAKFSFDLNHLSLEENPADAIIANTSFGWYSLEVRDGELWATNIEWTNRAESMIRAKELGYISPAFNIEKSTRRVADFINCALTNTPAMDTVASLMALSGAVPFKAYPVVDGSWDADKAVGSLRSWATKKNGEIDWDKYAQGFAYVSGEGDKFGDFHLPHHRVEDGKLVTVRSGVIAAGNAVQGARGGVSIPASDLPSVKTHLEKHYHEFNMQAPWEKPAEKHSRGKTMKSKAELCEAIHAMHKKIMGDAHDPETLSKKLDSMSHEDVHKLHEKMKESYPSNEGTGKPKLEESRHSEADDDDDEPEFGKDGDGHGPHGKEGKKESKHSMLSFARKITGKRDADEAVGGLMGMFHSMKERIDSLEKSGETSTRETILANAQREGRITPEQAKSTFMASLSVPQLKAYVAEFSPIVRTQPLEPGASPQGNTVVVKLNGVQRSVMLTAEDLEIMKNLGITDDKGRETYALNKLDHFRQ